MTEVEAQQAEAVATAYRQALERWRENFAQRDALVRASSAAGVNKHQIHTLTGLARTTIDDILKNSEEQ